ncbi:MAG: DNA polymerase III subunit delta [Sphingobacteriales bacterium 41-5]|nr:MAG: DNA polymerase III subunit delta [Sphingobacteriales bacterium 41-5]
MAIEKILSEWKKKVFKPIYWLEGEEEYYIDKLVDFAEHRILSDREASFNLTIFYGRDSNWADIVNACRRYPMFSDFQVVLIKEAQHLREIDKLDSYFQNPLHSTVLVVAYKDKKLDARTKFAKLVKEKAEVLVTKKMYDSALPDWVNKMVNGLGYTITPKGNALLVEHIGNDLNRIENEIEKILINVGSRKSITEEDIEQFVGISKEYNIFELQSALANKDMPKAIKIIQYFGANPKVAPMQLVLPSLYAFFSKVYMTYGVSGADETIAKQIGVSPFFMKDYLKASKTYGFSGTEKILLLLHQYNLKSIGINSARVEDADLMKELVVKAMM